MNAVEEPTVRVVLFSGGSGSQLLSASLIRDPRVDLTVAINGYDDGKSTGAVRRYLGDSLGPSDYRKNASWLATELGCAPPGIVALLNERLPATLGREQALARLQEVSSDRDSPCSRPLRHFLDDLEQSASGFDLADCSIGNLVFAGCYLACEREFNRAIEAYCSLLGLPSDLVINVTDGADAHLVAVDRDGTLLGSEAAIVEAPEPIAIEEIFLLDRALEGSQLEVLAALTPPELTAQLHRRSILPRANPLLLQKLRAADLVVFAPGTQHSSLLPSYLTPGVGTTIADNLKALKILITNIHEDAEIGDTSAAQLVDKALYYLRERDTERLPAPSLVTHVLLNDPGTSEPDRPYVPLGRLQDIEDPRLVRIGDYEDGDSGRHDAAKVLGPLVESFLQRRRLPQVAVLLLETRSADAVAQTLLEMMRAGIDKAGAAVTVFHAADAPLGERFLSSAPFEVRRLDASTGMESVIAEERFDFVLFFESSGMYKGHDIVNVAALLRGDRFDAVWGSRRLSIRDIRASYKLRYRHNLALGSISYLGSHLLSLAYLLLYGRYISDTLSGVRAVRRSLLQAAPVTPDDARLNQRLLSLLMRSRGEIFETPVQFFSLGPDQVRRTTVGDGLRSLATIVRWRWRPPPHPEG